MVENLDMTAPRASTPAIKDSEELELTLSLPLTNSLSSSSHHQTLSNESKLKRELKRIKTHVVVDNHHNGWRKVPIAVAPPLLESNAGGFQGQFGANSSDTSSNSSHPHLQMSSPKRFTSQLDLQSNASSSNHSNSCSDKFKLVLSSTQSSKPSERETNPSNTSFQQNVAPLNSDKDPNTTHKIIIPKIGKGETGKPPRPIRVTKHKKLLYSHMPCVSTTGNGPKGKSITGFLYKYTKSEVRIICVCHGSLFSPMEFVEHAGGVDVEYPLRHIRVDSFGLS